MIEKYIDCLYLVVRNLSGKIPVNIFNLFITTKSTPNIVNTIQRIKIPNVRVLILIFNPSYAPPWNFSKCYGLNTQAKQTFYSN